MLSAVEFLAVVVIALCLAVAAIPMRRHLIRRAGATFDCAVRTVPAAHPGDASGWSFAVGRYQDLAVELFRVFSYSPRPRMSLARRGFDVVERREAAGEETRTLLPGWSVLECVEGSGRPVELAMAGESMTAFLAWVEAAPPGWNTSRVS
jgi:hypothetical protein